MVAAVGPDDQFGNNALSGLGTSPALAGSVETTAVGRRDRSPRPHSPACPGDSSLADPATGWIKLASSSSEGERFRRGGRQGRERSRGRRVESRQFPRSGFSRRMEPASSVVAEGNEQSKATELLHSEAARSMLLASLEIEVEDLDILSRQYPPQQCSWVCQRLPLEVRYEPNGKPPQRSRLS